MAHKHKREHFIPAGAVQVSHKHSSAVAWIYTNAAGKPCAVVFHGRAQKPAWRYRFSNTQSREASIVRFFDSVQAREDAIAARKAKGRGLAVGDMLKTCWGYEQTNVEWFQITGLIGKAMVEIREVACDAVETEWLQGKIVPLADQFVGEPLRRIARDGAVKIDEVRTAWKVEPLAMVGNKAVYPAAHYTAYH